MKEFAKIYEICDTLNVVEALVYANAEHLINRGIMVKCNHVKIGLGRIKMWSCMAKDRVKLICH